MATEKLEERMVAVELKITDHGQRIGRIEGKVESLHTDLAELKRILVNIKWWLIGVGSVYVAEQFGVVPLIKRIIAMI